MCRKVITLVVVLIIVLLKAGAQDVRDFTFSHVGPADGLCSQRIYSIKQTSDGALWWSNKDGVERYNGLSIKHYKIGNQDDLSHHAGHIT